METRRWVNPTLPQTLQIAVLMLYISGALDLLQGLPGQFIVLPAVDLLRFVVPLAMAAAAFLMANERKQGWILAVVVAALPLVCRILVMFGISFGVDVGAHSPLSYDVIGLMFEVAIFALVVHPQSRDYQRIWFR